jgi:hypothetical protein
MLTEEQFVEQQRSLGRRIHEHDGVYWETVYPFYCKPVFVYKPFDPGEARPSRARSLLGFSHQVRNPAEGNRSVPLMVLARDGLDSYGLHRLPSRKRTYVRRALEICVIKPIDDIGENMERMREINLSQALRQELGAGVETPARRYTLQADEWRAQMRREFPLEHREWWGAFVGGILAAYLRTYQVEGVRVIQQAKADSVYLKFHPMDALYHAVLSHAAKDPTCQLIVNGGPRHRSLNHYKEQFLFSVVNFPYYSSTAWLVEFGKRFTITGSGRPTPRVEKGSKDGRDGA